MPAIAEQRIARVIRSRTKADETMLVWGHAEDMYFLSNRLAPTRYYKYYGFMTPPSTIYGPPTLNVTALEHARQFLVDMSEDPPAAVVLTSAMSSASIDVFPEFAQWLREGYRRISVADHLELWLENTHDLSGT